MILEQLVKYYDRMAADPLSAGHLAKPGYSLQKVSFCVVLEPDGSLQGFQSLLDSGTKKPLPRQLLVPGQAKPSGSGINPCFLWDNAAYMLGFKVDDPKPDRTRESFETFRDQHLAVEHGIASPAFSAVCTFLRNWSPEQAAAHRQGLAEITGSFGVFRIAGTQLFVHDDPGVITYRAIPATADTSAPRGFCLVSGQQEPIARIHEPKIKGVRGAQTAGALLVSFNEDAYTSLGKEQSFNAPISVGAAFKYTNALNHLLGRDDRRMFLGDATVVYWADRQTPLEDFVSEFLAESPALADDAPIESRRRAEQVRLFLSQLRGGHASQEAIDPSDATHFYILGLSPNASRISVRFWADSTVGEMKARLTKHMESLALAGERDPNTVISVRRIVNATARVYNEKPDYDSISPRLSGEIARAVFNGTAFPNELLAAILRRISADGQIDHTRAAIIKSFLLREGRISMDVYLSKEHAEPSYHCGRLLAVLAFAQERALGTINSGVIRRNLGSVMATPGLRLGRLQQAAEVGHIPKLDGDLPVFVRDELKAINVSLRDALPVTLDLRGQGVFMLGFYQQLQYLDFVGTQVANNKRVRTVQGEWVRSQGEARVAELLTKLGLPYVYEPRAILKTGAERWPDFVIRGNTRQEDIYVEYLGMNTEEYNKRWDEKLIAYRDFGITGDGGENGRLVILDARSGRMGDNEMLDRLRPRVGARDQHREIGLRRRSSMSKPIENRYDFVYLFDVTDGNPNGDPDASNLPRIDPETSQGLVTDVCLKRKIRNFVGLTHGEQPPYEIYVKEKAVLNQQHDRAYKALALEPKARKSKGKEKADEDRRLTQWMCANFYDIRAFGAVMTTEINCGQVRGPIQFTLSRSIDRIFSQEHAVTRCAVTTEREAEKQEGDNRTMGRKFTVPYGLYRGFGYINPWLADPNHNGTGFSEEDLSLLKKSLGQMFENDRSAARGQMRPVRCIVFRHENKLGNARADQLFARVKVDLKDELKQSSRPPRSKDDYTISVAASDLPPGVTLEEWV